MFCSVKDKVIFEVVYNVNFKFDKVVCFDIVKCVLFNEKEV